MTIRKATREDAGFIAISVMEAVGMPVMEGDTEVSANIPRIEVVCTHDDTLYSWRNTLIAEVDGKVVGCLVAYDGHGYVERRNFTFSLVSDIITFDVTAMDAETGDGEYYLDSLAVLPEYRGKGIGRQLLQRGIDEGLSRRLLPVLACAPDNVCAHRLYTSLGFADDGMMFIFGEDYIRMTISRR